MDGSDVFNPTVDGGIVVLTDGAVVDPEVLSSGGNIYVSVAIPNPAFVVDATNGGLTDWNIWKNPSQSSAITVYNTWTDTYPLAGRIVSDGQNIQGGYYDQITLPASTKELIADVRLKITSTSTNTSRNDKFVVDLSDNTQATTSANTVTLIEKSQLDASNSAQEYRGRVTLDTPLASATNRQLRLYVLGGTLAAGNITVVIYWVRLTARLCNESLGEC
ncbi:MAG: hypothetical protein IPJ88_08635 [Myxococcales bacterium]|nr:MAG: hypothetical protein IPJ88_08635 [Myxococcales bacterium]